MSNSKPLFSCVSYNFNNYEKFYEIPESAINNDAEYIYITNDKSLTSSTWTIVYKECDADPFYAVCDVRYHIFDYINSDIAVMFDGSMKLSKDVMPIVYRFNEGNFDFASIVHPTRNTVYTELGAWVGQRGMDIILANDALTYMHNTGYDVLNYKGLFQINFMVVRKTARTVTMLEDTFGLCKYLGGDGSRVFRCDQVIVSYIINHRFMDLKLMPLGQYICFNNYFKWCRHGTDSPMYNNGYNDITPFLRNEITTVWYI